MRSLAEIHAIAAERKGGTDALEAQLDRPCPAAELAELPEDRWLAQMAKSVFQAGFNWKLIEAKWAGFEEAFEGFDVDACAFMPEEWFEALCADRRIVRNPAKIRSVQKNAQFLKELRAEGGAGRVLGHWPSRDYVGLLARLKREGSRLGGLTGQYAMRFIGRDGFILSRDVVARLMAEGVVDRPPTARRDLARVQEAFNAWMEESGRSLTEISRILAMSI